jgi:NAD(P)-dependent dehydrogenase (short-subunit alcohol dehydrogenase family)
MKLDNKIVLVTGVSSGIGAATASLLRAQGAQVIGVDLKAPHMTLDGFVQGDLSSAENIDRLLPQLPARFDSLCNIAGVPGTANPQLLARVNYLGLRHLSQALLPRINAGGSIVNMPRSSVPSGRCAWNSTRRWRASKALPPGKPGWPSIRCRTRPATSTSRKP